MQVVKLQFLLQCPTETTLSCKTSSATSKIRPERKFLHKMGGSAGRKKVGKTSLLAGDHWSSSSTAGALSSLKLHTSFEEGCDEWVCNSQDRTSCSPWSLNLHGWNLCDGLNWPLNWENSWNYSGAEGVKKNTLDSTTFHIQSHLSWISRMELYLYPGLALGKLDQFGSCVWRCPTWEQWGDLNCTHLAP